MFWKKFATAGRNQSCAPNGTREPQQGVKTLYFLLAAKYLSFYELFKNASTPGCTHAPLVVSYKQRASYSSLKCEAMAPNVSAAILLLNFPFEWFSL
jgi:hypothetical protein